MEQFLAALNFLNEKEKFVIEAKLDNWLTMEIAKELGISENAVHHLKSRARRKIRERHDFPGYSWATHGPNSRMYYSAMYYFANKARVANKIAACHFHINRGLRLAALAIAWAD